MLGEGEPSRESTRWRSGDGRFGGNGPIHAADIASDLGIRTVLIPPAPGVFSAVGLLEARQERHFTQSLFGPFNREFLTRIDAGFADLETRAMAEILGEQAGEAPLLLQRGLDLRYAGQGFELSIDVPSGPMENEWLEQVTDAFTREHERTYGHSAPGEPLEIVNLRLVAQREQHLTAPERAVKAPTGVGAGDRPVYFGPDRGSVATPVLGRGDLDTSEQPGPLVIQEYDSTTIVPPGATARLETGDNIIVTIANVDA